MKNTLKYILPHNICFMWMNVKVFGMIQGESSTCKGICNKFLKHSWVFQIAI